MATKFKRSDLRRWRAAVLIRDDFRCQVCNTPYRVARHRLHAHHVYPKSIYPLRAYDLNNGVAVCAGCHIGGVHADNVKGSWWKRWRPFFRAYLRLSRVRKYNAANQGRIIKKRRRPTQ